MIVNFEKKEFVVTLTPDASFDFMQEEQQTIDVAIERKDFACNFEASNFVCSFGGATGGNYEGSYTVTPSERPQTLATSGKTLGQDVVVNAIPSNYGKITYDGTKITVS